MNDFIFTSQFWNWWVILLTLGNIAACWWLIRWTSKPQAGESASGEVTGHKWDETLEEYNNPLPRWWLWLFYITMVFGLAYFAIYPGLGTWKGTNNWTGESQYEEEIAAADAKYGPIFANFAKQDMAALVSNDDAMKAGQRLFLNYCATCHGSDARGTTGFPNLADNDWLYGGDPATIKTSILQGRTGAMPSWQAALGDQGVDEAAEYVLSLSGRSQDAAKASAGKTRYDMMCMACHGPDGKGMQALGAPNLTDNIWLYGGSPGKVRESIANGRSGRMPAHADFLGEDKAHVLAAYVYSLSQ